MFLLFDIGGTKMRLAVSGDGEKLGEPKIVPTPKSFEEGLALFKETAQELTKGGEIKKVAGGLPGVFGRGKDVLLRAPNLSGWVNLPVKKKLEEALGVPVYLENDADLVGLGEAVVGAGKGHEIVVYITVSTGIGGTRIVDGKIDTSAYGFEPGHQIIDADASIWPEGKEFINQLTERGLTLGSVSTYISGSAVKLRYGRNPIEIKDSKIWNEIARLLAYALNNTIVHWSPDVVVLGGGMMKEDGVPLDEVKKNLGEILKIYPEVPAIKRAELGDVGGLHGALSYLKQLVKI